MHISNVAVISCNDDDVTKWMTGARDHGGKRVERAKKDQQKRTAAAANLSECDSVEN